MQTKPAMKSSGRMSLIDLMQKLFNFDYLFETDVFVNGVKFKTIKLKYKGGKPHCFKFGVDVQTHAAALAAGITDCKVPGSWVKCRVLLALYEKDDKLTYVARIETYENKEAKMPKTKVMQHKVDIVKCGRFIKCIKIDV